MQLGEKPVEPVAHVAERPELAREVGERSVQLAQRAAELVRARQRPEASCSTNSQNVIQSPSYW